MSIQICKAGDMSLEELALLLGVELDDSNAPTLRSYERALLLTERLKLAEQIDAAEVHPTSE